MILRILFKDNTVKEIKNVYKVSNLSTRLKNDCLYYETTFDVGGKGTCVHYDEILCFEVQNVN